MARFHRIFGHKAGRLRHAPKLHRFVRKRHLRRHAMAVPMGEGMILCRILGTYKLYCDPDDRCISPHLVLDGIWEPRTRPSPRASG